MTATQILIAALALLAAVGFARAACWRHEARLWKNNATMWREAWNRDVPGAKTAPDASQPQPRL